MPELRLLVRRQPVVRLGQFATSRTRRWREEDVDGLVVRIADRCEAWLAEQGFPADDDATRDDELDDALPLILSAGVAGRGARPP